MAQLLMMLFATSLMFESLFICAKPVDNSDRPKREYSPFNLQQFFQRKPSPLDNSQNLDNLIKRGLNALNDLTILARTTASPANESERNRNSNVANVDNGPNSLPTTPNFRTQIEEIQTRLNALALEMSRFIQTLTQSTARLFPSFSSEPVSLPGAKRSGTANNNKPLNIFSLFQQ